VVPVTAEQVEQGMVGHGVPAPVAAVLASAEVNIARGRLGEVSGDVESLIGGKPQSFEEWLAANKAAFSQAA
jgi:NAD(P)H dehydrogenase (quinone)